MFSINPEASGHLDFFATFCIKAKSRSESTSCEKIETASLVKE
jgi:hypothetical protein